MHTYTRDYMFYACTVMYTYCMHVHTFRSIFPITYGSPSSENRRAAGWSRPAVLCAVIAASACGACMYIIYDSQDHDTQNNIYERDLRADC